MSEAADEFEQWCILELLGRRKLSGLVRSVTIAGHGFLRLDEPDQPVGDGSSYVPGRTQFIAPTAVYAIHPVAEEVARGFRGDDSRPVTAWEYRPQAAPNAIAAAMNRDEEPWP